MLVLIGDVISTLRTSSSIQPAFDQKEQMSGNVFTGFGRGDLMERTDDYIVALLDLSASIDAQSINSLSGKS